MRANFQKLSSRSLENSFVDFWVKANAFGFHWHYHPELEICYVKRGRGKRIIGESIEDFTDGDLVLVGSNVPHSWITDEGFNASPEEIEVFVIQFDIEVFNQLDTFIEFDRIRSLFKGSERGIFFKGPENTDLIDTLSAISAATGFEKLLHLLNLLNGMAGHSGKVYLNELNYKAVLSQNLEKRILKVCNYIHERYKQDISIGELADLIAMNPTAFCRFFKRILGKTVGEYIVQLRMSYVCNQIQHTTMPIYQIAYESGFSSIAHFNKQFKKSMGRTPTAYRKLFR